MTLHTTGTAAMNENFPFPEPPWPRQPLADRPTPAQIADQIALGETEEALLHDFYLALTRHGYVLFNVGVDVQRWHDDEDTEFVCYAVNNDSHGSSDPPCEDRTCTRVHVEVLP